MNDSSIFEQSRLKIEHQSNPLFKSNCRIINGVEVPVLLIGDSAFRISDILLKPYPYKADQPNQERVFNYHLSKCKRVVENAFGQLKARFRRIGRGLEVNIDNATPIIQTCCILHNICNNQNDHFKNAWLKEFKKNATRIQPQTRTTIDERNESNNGNIIRKAIANFLGN